MTSMQLMVWSFFVVVLGGSVLITKNIMGLYYVWRCMAF